MTKRMIPNVRRGDSSDCTTATDTTITTTTTIDRMVRRWEGWMLQDVVHCTYRYVTLCMTVRISNLMIHCILRTINRNSVFHMILIHHHRRRRRRWW